MFAKTFSLIAKRTGLLFVVYCMAMPLSLQAQPKNAPESKTERATGPYLGHVDSKQALIWYRPTEAGKYVLLVMKQEEGKKEVVSHVVAEAERAHDLCLVWRAKGLSPGTTYRYEIRESDVEGPLVVGGADFKFRTPEVASKPGEVTLAFGSCASSTDFYEIWAQIDKQQVDGLVLLGDTPYIDSSDREFNRQRHREFLSIPTLATLGRSTPVWGTWDDHDFGGNDTDGNVKDKEVIRQVFTEYRAHDQFGDGNEGIYTRFRRGPIEVFLLDARYFSQTEPSPAAADKKTCLGKKQWEWLLQGLKESTAPFKILASGQIWDDKTNGEKDDWHTYAHEREALFDFIRDQKIDGVILMGGDIHASRELRYDNRVGYPLWQFIVSPMHASTIPSLNVPHPNLVWGKPVPNVFLRVVADSRQKPNTLVATWLTMSGETINEVRIEADQLRAK